MVDHLAYGFRDQLRLFDIDSVSTVRILQQLSEHASLHTNRLVARVAEQMPGVVHEFVDLRVGPKD